MLVVSVTRDQNHALNTPWKESAAFCLIEVPQMLLLRYKVSVAFIKIRVMKVVIPLSSLQH